jgi:hypothetical protein
MNAPKRRFVLKIEIGADTWNNVLDDLHDIVCNLEDADSPAVYKSCMGGVSVGHLVEVNEDPSMTQERYFQELETYLSALEKTE